MFKLTEKNREGYRIAKIPDIAETPIARNVSLLSEQEEKILDETYFASWRRKKSLRACFGDFWSETFSPKIPFAENMVEKCSSK